MSLLNLGEPIASNTALLAATLQAKFNAITDYINGANIESAQLKDNRAWTAIPMSLAEVQANDGNPQTGGSVPLPAIGTGLMLAKYVTMSVWLDLWEANVIVQYELPSAPGVWLDLCEFWVDGAAGWQHETATLNASVDLTGAKLRFYITNTATPPAADPILYSLQVLVWCQSKLTRL